MIVGDVMVESYLWGVVDRISPEAPVPGVDVNYLAAVLKYYKLVPNLSL